MTNWLWMIPWIVVIIFYAGNRWGAMITRKRLKEQHFEEKNRQFAIDSYGISIEKLFNRLDMIDCRISELEAKIDKNNITEVK